jgi:carboxyl-terminal processing protease
MKRLVPFALALALALVPAHAPPADASAGLTQQQSQELVQSYAHLTSEFYKKVDRQVVLDGARKNLVAYLEAHCVASPNVKPMHATDDDSVNVRELADTVSAAIGAYAEKIGDHDVKDKACRTTLKRYGEKTGATYINYAAIAGALGAVKDRYTVFLSPKEFAELNEGLDGTEFGGVGLSYDIDDKTKNIHVQNVILDGPADKAGVLSDDVITVIDGKNVHDQVDGKTPDLQTKAVQSLLRGEPGTKVTLTIVRDGKPIDPITVTRAVIHQPSVYSKLLPGGIGWVNLTVFGSDTARELTTALNRLDAQGAKAYILDLRYNGGGYLNAAVDVSSKFISSGPIVTVESRAGTSTEYDAENEAIAPRPLVVLVNQYTASASEITAGAIQDSGVGTLMGVKTFGKGVVQSIYPLGDGSAVKITTARYLTPRGRDINKIGITPDVSAVIPDKVRIRMGDPSNDPQLQSAIGFLQGKIAQNPAH